MFQRCLFYIICQELKKIRYRQQAFCTKEKKDCNQPVTLEWLSLQLVAIMYWSTSQEQGLTEARCNPLLLKGSQGCLCSILGHQAEKTATAENSGDFSTRVLYPDLKPSFLSNRHKVTLHPETRQVMWCVEEKLMGRDLAEVKYSRDAHCTRANLHYITLIQCCSLWFPFFSKGTALTITPEMWKLLYNKHSNINLWFA